MKRKLDIPGWTRQTSYGGITTWRSDRGLALSLSEQHIELRNEREGSAFASLQVSLADAPDLVQILTALSRQDPPA